MKASYFVPDKERYQKNPDMKVKARKVTGQNGWKQHRDNGRTQAMEDGERSLVCVMKCEIEHDLNKNSNGNMNL